jgi:hypothetical protein
LPGKAIFLQSYFRITKKINAERRKIRQKMGVER